MIKGKKWQYLPFVIFFCSLLLLLEWSVTSGLIPSFIIPAPSQVLGAFAKNWRSLLTVHLPVTVAETLLGFALALVLGVSLALAMHYATWIKQLCYPFILLSQTIPLIALSPIFILWFGYTIWSKVAMAFLLAFFPIVIGLFDGLNETDREAIALFQSMGASGKTILLQLQVPYALPTFFAGLKMSILYSMVGATIGEWLGAAKGLGYYTRRMSGNLQAAQVFAAIVLLSMTGIVLFSTVALIETVCFSWRKGVSKSER